MILWKVLIVNKSSKNVEKNMNLSVKFQNRIDEARDSDDRTDLEEEVKEKLF